MTTASQDRQRTQGSAKSDNGSMSGVSRATTLDPQNRQEKRERAAGTTTGVHQDLYEEWDHGKLKRLLEVQYAFPLAAPVAPPSSVLADMISPDRHHQDHTSIITTITASAKGKDQAETTVATKYDPKDSSHNHRTANIGGMLPRSKCKYTKRKKDDDDAVAVTKAGEPAKKKQARTRAFITQCSGKRRGDNLGEAAMEADATTETARPKPIRKNHFRGASASKRKQKATTENRKGKPRGRKDRNTKTDAVNEDELEPVNSRKTRTKVSTNKGVGKGKAMAKEADGDMDDEPKGGEPLTANGKWRRATSKGRSNEENYDAKVEDHVIFSVETSHSAASKRKGKARARDDDGVANEHALVPINPSDPCSIFPTELWHVVLDHLPLSQIARTASANNAWLTGARSYRGWAIAAARCEMGVPKVKYKTFMALVCSRSYFVCDRCLRYSTGKDLRSRIPLPVQVNDDAANTWMLCHDCRREYYRKYPERLRKPCDPTDKNTYVVGKRICKMAVMWDYCLYESDLVGLQFGEYENQRHIRGYPIRLYDELAVQKRAHSVHAGWVGVDGAKANVPKSRRAAFKAREESNKIRRKSTKENKPTPTKTPEAPIHGQHGDDFYGVYESDWREFFDDNYGEGPSNQFGNL